MERWVTNKTIYEGDIIRLRSGQVRLDDGRIVQREVVDHPGGVAVAPYHEGNVIMLRQFRIAVGADVLELPAGRLEPDEEPAHRAAVELEEEIGYQAGQLIPIASCYCSPGFTNELDHIFLGLDLVKTEARPEHDEVIEIVEMPLGEAIEMVKQRRILDADTIIGLLELDAYLRAHA